MNWLKKMIQNWKIEYYRNWAWVPPPNYRCSHGKQGDCRYGDYW